MSLAANYFPCLLGMQCDGFTIIAADQSNIMFSMLVMKNDDDKIQDLGNNVMMGVVGEPGDVTQFTNYVSKNIKLYNIRNGYQLNTTSTVHFIRKSLSEILRTAAPSLINILIGGYDMEAGAELYAMDFLASCVKLPYSTFGLSGVFCRSIMDQYYRSSLTVVEAYEVMKLCVKEIHQRFVVNLPTFQVKIVSKEGIQTMPNITAYLSC